MQVLDGYEALLSGANRRRQRELLLLPIDPQVPQVLAELNTEPVSFPQSSLLCSSEKSTLLVFTLH